MAYTMLQLATGKSFELATDNFKVALYTNSATPDNTVTTAALSEYGGAGAVWASNEVTSTGYSAGGASVTPVTCTQASNVVTFASSGSPLWTGVTFSTAGGFVYDTSVTNVGLCYNYFGGVQSVTAATFAVSWNASGIVAFST
jgi:hypothetical protein